LAQLGGQVDADIMVEVRIIDQQAGARALILKLVAGASTATPRARAMARRFSERFDAYRDAGICNATAYAMASAESREYVWEMEQERAFA
jgi:hypothetical protein